MSGPAKSDVEAKRQLAESGADRAAEAFAMLVGRAVEAGAVELVEVVRRAAEDDPAATGVFFELEGCLEAIVAIVFPGEASDRLVRRIVGIESGALDPAITESALMEVGNILVSHVASAIADELGDRLLPSIPALAMESADRALEEFLVDRVAGAPLRFASTLRDEAGEGLGWLVLVMADGASGADGV